MRAGHWLGPGEVTLALPATSSLDVIRRIQADEVLLGAAHAQNPLTCAWRAGFD